MFECVYQWAVGVAGEERESGKRGVREGRRERVGGEGGIKSEGKGGWQRKRRKDEEGGKEREGLVNLQLKYMNSA